MTSLTLQYSPRRPLPALHAPDQPNFVSANCLAQQYSDSGLSDRRVSTVHMAAVTSSEQLLQRNTLITI